MNAITAISRPLATLRLDPSLRRAAPAGLPQLSQDHVCLIGAKDSYRATYQQVCEVPTPEERYNEKGHLTYQPVPYATLLDGLRDSFSEALNLEPMSESYALARQGQQLYGMMTWRLPESDTTGLCLALRGSHDGQIASAFGIGQSVFVCANGAFSVDGMVKSARHTSGTFDKLRELTSDVSSTAISDFRTIAAETSQWQDIKVKSDLFYAYVGILQGREIISSQLASTAYKYWAACHAGKLHDAHGQTDDLGRSSLWSAYQAVTAAMQRSAPIRAFGGYGGLHHVTRAISASGGSVEDATIPELDIEKAMREHA